MTEINYEEEVRRVYLNSGVYSLGPATDMYGNVVSPKKYSFTTDVDQFWSDTPSDSFRESEPDPIRFSDTEDAAWKSAYEKITSKKCV